MMDLRLLRSRHVILGLGLFVIFVMIYSVSRVFDYRPYLEEEHNPLHDPVPVFTVQPKPEPLETIVPHDFTISHDAAAETESKSDDKDQKQEQEQDQEQNNENGQEQGADQEQKQAQTASQAGDSKDFALHDGSNLLLTHEQCIAAFPNLFDPIEASMESRKNNKVTLAELDNIKIVGCYIRVLIHEGEVLPNPSAQSAILLCSNCGSRS